MKISGKIAYCFTDVNGFTQEFATLTECKKEAVKHSKENPELEINIYAMSDIYIKNGKNVYEEE